MDKVKLLGVITFLKVDVTVDELEDFIKEYKGTGKITSNLEKGTELKNTLNSKFDFNHSVDEWVNALITFTGI